LLGVAWIATTFATGRGGEEDGSVLLGCCWVVGDECDLWWCVLYTDDELIAAPEPIKNYVKHNSHTIGRA